jgi:hypothetical protein
LCGLRIPDADHAIAAGGGEVAALDTAFASPLAEHLETLQSRLVASLEDTEEPILVRQFHVEGLGVAIRDYPASMEEALENLGLSD